MIVKNYFKLNCQHHILYKLISRISLSIQRCSSTTFFFSKFNYLAFSFTISMLLYILHLKFLFSYSIYTLGLIEFISFNSLLQQFSDLRSHILMSKLLRCLFIYDFDLLSTTKQNLLLKNIKSLTKNELVFLIRKTNNSNSEYFYNFFQMKYFYVIFDPFKNLRINHQLFKSTSNFNRTIILNLSESMSKSNIILDLNRYIKNKTIFLLNKNFFIFLNILLLKKVCAKHSGFTDYVTLKRLLLKRYKFFIKSNHSTLVTDNFIIKSLEKYNLCVEHKLYMINVLNKIFWRFYFYFNVKYLFVLVYGFLSLVI
mmetsp:Transcript_34275/g.55105  ORF Transcript_34275/g.55105 Transcript_34275/m.55105 type:complete len:312 (-) Transcript_34275:1158-2093(-)